MDGLLCRQPSLRRDNQGLYARLQRWMNDRRKLRTVADRKFIEPTGFLGLCVHIGIGAAHEPKHGGNVPLGSERSEILAGWRRSGLPDALGGEVPTKSVHYALGRLRVIHVKRIVVQRCDLRGPRCA